MNHPKLLTSKTLKDFEELLPTDIFIRTHHFYLVNLNYIKRYIKGDGRQIRNAEWHIYRCARRKKEIFLQAMGSKS